MKFSVLVTHNTTQFCIVPETDEEQRWVNLLVAGDEDTVTIHRDISVAESAGGYLRAYKDQPENKGLAIAIRRKEKA